MVDIFEVVKCLAPHVDCQISYLCSYNNNFENLKKEIEELTGDSLSVQHKVDKAKRKGEQIEKDFERWLLSVSSAIVDVEKLVSIHEATENKLCFMGLCPNLKARIQLSQDAVRHLEAISILREAGRPFHTISYRSIPEDTRLLRSSKDYEVFESRMSTLNDVLDALKDQGVNMLGIYGMGGVGKTALAKDVARHVKSDKLFDQVVFAEVSQSRDIRRIQEEIAHQLGLMFPEESESIRAMRLYDRLKIERHILIILDNIWENFDLEAVGIPLGDDHKGCKVLLTARSLDVLYKMDSPCNFPVGVLKEEEAWSLFKKITGDYIESSQFKSLAIDVVKKCAGLPVSIVTIARALRNKRRFEWEYALMQLNNPSSEDFQEIQSATYSAVKLSYNNLKGVMLKNTFLLIAYAYLESIDALLMYGVGLGLFSGVNHMEWAANQVHALVHELKASCMLLDHTSNDEERFSMHDAVRDVAISIASRDKNVLMMTNGELVNRGELSDKFYTSIILFDVKTNSLPCEELDCPKLELFRMVAAKTLSSLTIPDNFFAKMKKVRVLDLTYLNLLSPPSSLGDLTNLRTLCLYYCKLQDTAVIGNFKKLEILCLRGSEIKRLSEEIGQLTLLRLLDLRWCEGLEVIPPNVLSKLCRLEELYIYSFKWGVEVEGLKNASLDELMHLRKLTSLELRIEDANTLPRGLFFKNLKGFDICIGNYNDWHDAGSCRTFMLELNTNRPLKDGLILQLRRVEDLYLSGLQDGDVKNFIHELDQASSLQLKRLYVKGAESYFMGSDGTLNKLTTIREESTSGMRSNEITCDDSLFTEKVSLPYLEDLSLYSINIERIWQRQSAAMSCGIQHLTYLTVSDCRNLKILFSTSILSSSCFCLKYLDIEKCPILEEIIIADQTERKKAFQSLETEIVADDERDNAGKVEIIFRELKQLYLCNLDCLSSFCFDNCSLDFPSLVELVVENCPNMKIFSGGELSTPELRKVQLDRQWTEQHWIWKDDLNTTIRQQNILKQRKLRIWKKHIG